MAVGYLNQMFLPLTVALLSLQLIATADASSQFNFSSVFGSHMVLQRGPAIAAVYGYGAPGMKVTVSVKPSTHEQANVLESVTVRDDGNWKVSLGSAYKGGVSATITASGTMASSVSAIASISLTDVVFGDVYFCSGQSNMELDLHFSLTRNKTYDAIKAGKYANIRFFHFDHNPQPSATYVTNDSVVNGWQAGAASFNPPPSDPRVKSPLDAFSAACWYFGESLTDWMANSTEAVVPIGLIESAFGGTMIESWVDPDVQLASCSNITCTSNQSQHFTPENKQQCLSSVAPNTEDNVDVLPDHVGVTSAAIGAGSNGELYNGMVLPFVNMTVRGFLWYQGENNLGFHAGNVLDKAGYACMLPTMIQNWRDAWSVEPMTTSPQAAFGIVMLADSTDEGWGCNVPQMHWAQTANMGVVPNKYLPNTFFAAAHDLADPWADGCEQGASCCVDTGKPLDARCDSRHQGFLVQNGQFPGITQPVTPTMGLTIHPRVKRQIGQRLAQAAWSLVYNHSEVEYTGPVISGCTMTSASANGSPTRTITVMFNTELLKGAKVAVRDYNKTEQASVFWALMQGSPPSDADQNYLYTNRQPWWGDSSAWVNVDIEEGPEANTIVVHLPATGVVTAIKYGHMSPKGHPQSGEYKTCCGNRNFAIGACEPESCPISSGNSGLPAMPFHALIVKNKCKCFAPQTCDE